jgi:hypothetical protein
VDVKHIIVDGDMLALRGYGVTDPGKIEVWWWTPIGLKEDC